MNSPAAQEAAQVFLEDAFERQEGRRPGDMDELIEWCLLKWAEIRNLSPGPKSGGHLLAELAPHAKDEYPGLSRRWKE